MQKRYLVGNAQSQFSEEDFGIVTAASPEEAVEKYVREIAANDNLIDDYVRDKSINMGFGSHFWLQTKDENSYFDESGDIKINDEEFKRRVRKFFGERSDYADFYLEAYFRDDENPNIDVEFPDGMLAYIWLNSDYSEVKAFDLSEIKQVEA